jgi:hypothetical protein
MLQMLSVAAASTALAASSPAIQEWRHGAIERRKGGRIRVYKKEKTVPFVPINLQLANLGGQDLKSKEMSDDINHHSSALHLIAALGFAR